MFAPLGGVGEIGMNLSIYGLGDERTRAPGSRSISASRSRREEHLPGIDLIFPDIRYLVEERNNLAGLVLTHAHEDHYRRGARPVAEAEGAGLCHAVHRRAARRQARRRARRAGHPGQRSCSSAAASRSGRSTSSWSRWRIRSRNRTRSIIRTPAGTVLHTGDWKLDPTPVLGAADRRGEAARARRGGLPRADRRFHQRGARRPLAVGSRRRARPSPS